jgi:hypothetical protein
MSWSTDAASLAVGISILRGYLYSENTASGPWGRPV